METIISLIPNTDAITNTRQALAIAGFTENELSILRQPGDVWRRLGGWQKVWVVLKSTVVGALFGLVLYALFGNHTDTSICVFMNHPLATCYFLWVLTSRNWVVAFGILGAIFGLSVLVQDLYPYIEGVRRGETLLMMEVSEENASEAMRILREERGTLVQNINGESEV